MVFYVSLIFPSQDTKYLIDGVETIALAGKRYLLIAVENVGFKYVSELVFSETGFLSLSVDIEGRVFILELRLAGIHPYFLFTPVLLEDRCSFFTDDYFVDSFFPNNGGSSGASVDLTPVLSGITSLHNHINALTFPVTDLTPVLTKLDNLNYPDIDFSAFSFVSLNGNCGSLPDGTLVTVAGLEGDFEVSSSQFAWNDSTAQNSMIMYKLSKNGSFCLAPDVYVTAKAS